MASQVKSETNCCASCYCYYSVLHETPTESRSRSLPFFLGCWHVLSSVLENSWPSFWLYPFWEQTVLWSKRERERNKSMKNQTHCKCILIIPSYSLQDCTHWLHLIVWFSHYEQAWREKMTMTRKMKEFWHDIPDYSAPNPSNQPLRRMDENQSVNQADKQNKKKEMQ